MSEAQAVHYEAISAGIRQAATILIACESRLDDLMTNSNLPDEDELNVLWAMKAMSFAGSELVESSSQWQEMAIRERQMDAAEVD